IDPDDRAVLRRAFAEHHVLVMRDQHFAPDQFETAAQVFGEIQLHDKRERHVPGHPGVDYVSNDQIENGRRIIPGETFHPDHSNHPPPPQATKPFAVELPSRGGDTQYVNMHDAYDDLPADTKRRIDGLKAVHVYQSKYSPRPLGQITEESRSKLPPPGVHPLVRMHPENGRKALFLNPVRMESIVGMEDKEALALIDELMRHATQKKYEYRHKWRHGDWALCDNPSVMPPANPHDARRERTSLYRLMLKGEKPVWRRHCALTPANSTTLAHFAASSAMNLPNAAEEPADNVPPSSTSRALIFGSAKPAL